MCGARMKNKGEVKKNIAVVRRGGMLEARLRP